MRIFMIKTKDNIIYRFFAVLLLVFFMFGVQVLDVRGSDSGMVKKIK